MCVLSAKKGAFAFLRRSSSGAGTPQMRCSFQYRRRTRSVQAVLSSDTDESRHLGDGMQALAKHNLVHNVLALDRPLL